MTREETLAALRREPRFDLLVVGGGATGCGVALDAASRGLRVALVEKNDFAEGTSGRSTKLVHGGVRYLELAVRRLDRVQYGLVRQALHERGVLLRIAPHLCHRLPLVTPLYSWLEVPYVLSGLKLYDLLAGRSTIGYSRLVSRREAVQRFPMLKAEGLKAGALYYDGQFNDARMAVCLAVTAREQGAVMANHTAVTALLKERGRVCGAVVEEAFSGDAWPVHARAVVNATGPFADELRLLDRPGANRLLQLSAGIHLVLDARFAPPDTGLLIPRTEDGRVLFVLPWEGSALVGTTDEPAEAGEHPRPKEAEIAYLLRHLRRYFDLEVHEGDVKASWSGLRPLLANREAADTARLARDHLVEESPSGLLTIAGGKWTTYRRMAEDTVDQAVRAFGLKPARGCPTEHLPLAGGAGYDPSGAECLAADRGLDVPLARHLVRRYGDRAPRVLAVADEGLGRRLADGHPYLEAEVAYGVRHEMARRPLDVLARRLPLALLDTAAARAALPRVTELMARELGWTEETRRAELERAEQHLADAL
jgi:glycerol-3-phosphate dehydrogenase